MYLYATSFREVVFFCFCGNVDNSWGGAGGAFVVLF